MVNKWKVPYVDLGKQWLSIKDISGVERISKAPIDSTPPLHVNFL